MIFFLPDFTPPTYKTISIAPPRTTFGHNSAPSRTPFAHWPQLFFLFFFFGKEISYQLAAHIKY